MLATSPLVARGAPFGSVLRLPLADQMLFQWRSYQGARTTLATTMRGQGTTPPAIILSGGGITPSTLSNPYGIKIRAATGGALGVALIDYSTDGGGSYTLNQVTGAVLLGGTGITATCGAGTYNVDNTWDAFIFQELPPISGYPTMNPVGVGSFPLLEPTAGPNGRQAIWLNDPPTIDNIIGALTSMGTGAAQPFTLYMVAKCVVLDATFRTLFQTGDIVAAGKNLLQASNTLWRYRRIDDAAAIVTRTGGVPNTNWNIITVIETGANVEVKINNATVINAATVTGALTTTSISYGRGGIGSSLNMQLAETVGYPTAHTAAQQSPIYQYLKATWGL